MQWENIYVFVSSTFNDMHAERDYLVKSVFPELSEWCEARKLRLVDVDLRWGVTRADSESNNTVLTCLKNIDECRPFFLCFLGQRRGWVPEPDQIGATTIRSYPGLASHIGKTSVTEMEIEHALLSPMRRIVNGREETPAPADRALFFFRNDAFTHLLTDAQKKVYTNAAEKNAPAADQAITAFKDRVRARWDDVTSYDCRWDKDIVTTELLTEGTEVSQGRLVDFAVGSTPLKNVIIERLKAAIEKELPDHRTAAAQSALDIALEQQARFIEQNRDGFVPRDGDFDALSEYVDGDGSGPFVLTAPAGLGKTMLLSNFTHRLASGRHRVYARFCGASDLAFDTYSLWKSVFDEAGVESPPTLDELRQGIGGILETLARQGSCVIVFDAVNQLPNGLDMLEWLPHTLPEGLRLIVSLKEDETSSARIARLAEDKRITMASVRPFAEEADKRALIAAFLEKYLKALDEGHISAICSLDASENPLYLKIVLSEMRVFGAFKQLEDEIGRFGRNPVEAFGSVLERLENDAAYSAVEPGKAVPFLFGLLSCARKGLSEDEMVFCFKEEFAGASEDDIRHTVRLYVRQVRPFLARREGRIDYLYESFMLAARARYSGSLGRLHGWLADCFRSCADIGGDSRFEGKSARAFQELPYHMHHAGRKEALESMFCDYLWLFHKTRLCGVDETIADYGYVCGDDTEAGLCVIRDSLILSAHILREDVRQMPSQLWGRMAHLRHVEIRRLIEGSVRETNRPWLRPTGVCMDAPGGALIKTVLGQKGGVAKLLVKGDRLFSGAGDGSIWVWDLGQWDRRLSLKGHSAAIGDMIIQGNRLYSTSWDGTLRVWNSVTGDCVARWRISTSYGNGGRLAIWSGKLVLHASGEFTVWNAEKYDGVPERTFEGCQGRVSDMVVCGDLLFACLARIPGKPADPRIAVWDLRSGRCVGYLSGHTASATKLLVSGNRLISASQDKTIRIWDINTRSCVRILAGHSDAVTQIVLWDGRLISFSSDESVRFWDIFGGECLHCSEEIRVAPWDCLAHGSNLITSGGNGEIRVWDLDRLRTRSSARAKTAVTVRAGDYFVSALDDSAMRVDDREGNLLNTLRCSARITTLDYHRGRLFSGDYDGNIRMWDPVSGECLSAYSAKGGRIDKTLFAEDYLVVVVYSRIECLKIGSWKRVWEADRQGIVKTALRDRRLYVATKLTVNAGGKQDSRHYIEALDVETGTLLYSIETGDLAELLCESGQLITVEYGSLHKECDIVVRRAEDGGRLRSIPVSRPEATDRKHSSVTVWKAALAGRKIYLSLSDKQYNSEVKAWNLDTGDFLMTIGGLGHGVAERAETGGLFWERILEIASGRHFTLLWDTATDEPVCKFFADDSLFLYESGEELISYPRGSLVRLALENVPAAVTDGQ